MSLMQRGPLGLKPEPMTAERLREGKRHMARVAQLPCIICGARPVHVHHVIHGRYSQRRASDFEVIPLCPDCHQNAPWSIHRDKRRWLEQHGPDYAMLPQVWDALNGERNAP